MSEFKNRFRAAFDWDGYHSATTCTSYQQEPV